MQKAIFENTTVYDTELVNALTALTRRVVRKQTLSARKIAMLALAVFCCVLGIVCLTVLSQDTLGVCLLLVALLAAVRGLSFQKLKVWGGAPVAEENRTFVFLEDGIQLIRSNSKQKGCLYGDIMLHSETDDYFLLMQNLQTGFLIRKDGFTKGSIEDFRKFLVKKTYCIPFEIASESNN